MTHASKYLTAKHAPWLALLISGGLLVGAWIFQYGFDYPPCTMCYWQRHAHKVVLGVAAIAIALQWGWTSFPKIFGPKLFGLLLALAFLGSAYIAFWHVLVEFKILEGPQLCAVTGGGELGAFDPNDPLGGLDKEIKGPACSEPLWHFLGLSMAAWNGIISVVGAGVMLFLMKGKANV
ncbi:disulfide bond formation protein B [Hellea balneolensis]|uniref:disulfide bond formation protein B n=1 Tax=Hellea balneolensis TaxID=287478 RepID=UPI0004276272|nr:disulfide bond formation protein B [Hellea balneolensis]